MKSMSRRAFLQTTTAAAAGMAMSSCRVAGDGDTAAKRPNIVFVFPDQFRRQAMGFMGEDPVMTPSLDRFASQGLVFSNACANQPLCSPYRAMLLTGKYPFSNLVRSNVCSAHTQFGVYLRESERCLSDVLADAGYATGWIGKWHLDAPDAPDVDDWRKAVWDAYTPPGPKRHGFEFWHSYGCMNKHMHPHYWIGDAAEDEKTTFDDWSPRHEANVAIDYIKSRDANKPFALFVSMNPPHGPFDQLPDEYLERYAGKTPEDLLNRPNVDMSIDKGPTRKAKRWAKHYFAAVTGVDEQFGRILECLDDEGLADDTIVVFTADHGEMLGSHDRMGKSIWYEESLGIPFIIRWPRRIAAGRDAMPLSVPDLMPTLLGLSGLGGATPDGVEGTDHSALMLGQSNDRADSAMYLAPGLEKGPDEGVRGLRGLRTPTHFLLVQRGDSGEEYTLTDLERDPYQLHDVAGDNPTLVRELCRQLDGWLERTNDPWLDARRGPKTRAT